LFANNETLSAVSTEFERKGQKWTTIQTHGAGPPETWGRTLYGNTRKLCFAYANTPQPCFTVDMLTNLNRAASFDLSEKSPRITLVLNSLITGPTTSKTYNLLKRFQIFQPPLRIFSRLRLQRRDCRHHHDRISRWESVPNSLKREKLAAVKYSEANSKTKEGKDHRMYMNPRETIMYIVHTFKHDFRNEMNNYVTKSKMKLVIILYCLKVDCFELEASVNVLFIILRAFAATC